MAKSFFATLECKLIDRTSFRIQAEARLGIFEFIEGWYNLKYTHIRPRTEVTLLHKKSPGTAAKLSFLGHVLMDNRHCSLVDAHVTQATGNAEWEAVVNMAAALSGTHRATLGAD